MTAVFRANRIRAAACLAASALAATTLCACSIIKVPEWPPPITAPTSVVQRVALVDASDQAARYDITVEIFNPNTFEMSLTHVTYALTVDGQTYRTETLPNTTLSAGRVVLVTLPAVIEGGAAGGGGSFTTSGTFQMRPPGEIRTLMYEMGIPLPTTSFSGRGGVGEALEGIEPPAIEEAQPPE